MLIAFAHISKLIRTVSIEIKTIKVVLKSPYGN